MSIMKSKVVQYIKEPVLLTFLLSIVLSLIAVFGEVTIDKDGALYVDIAQSVSKEGLVVAFDKFNWPWYSILIAFFHNLTKIDHEVIAYTLAILFMAGTCSLIVSMVKNKTPEAVYWAVLLVLSVPAFNEFRGSVIRDTGFWFFTVLSVWIVISNCRVTFTQGLALQLTIICAALFRLEALFITFAIFIYLSVSSKSDLIKDKFFNIFKSFYIFFILSLVGMFAVFNSGILEQPRVDHYLNLINPYSLYESFLLVSDNFAQAALAKWSHSDATNIIFFGFLFALIIRIIGCAGVVSFMLLNANFRKKLSEGTRAYKLNFIAIAVYFCILLVFFIQARFTNSRYISMLLLLSVPIIAVAIYSVKDKWPKLINVFIVLSILMAFANVISISPKKTHYLEAAQWVKENTESTDRIYYDDGRVSYYAGRGYPFPEEVIVDDILNSEKYHGNYDYFVIESSASNESLLDWIEKNKFEIQTKKTNGKKVLFILKK